MNPAVEIEGIGKRYQIGGERESYLTLRDKLSSLARGSFLRPKQPATESFWALRDVSFKVQPGDVVGIVGRNGAGKSTLLKIISRITPPTEGRIRLRGRVGSLLEVGTGFHPELTGRENVFLSGAILGMSQSEIRRRLEQIVEFAEVQKFLDTPVKRYSSGMYARLAFSVAAHLESEILIIDEVLAVGDAAFQRKCLSRMGDIGVAGRTVFFVSHNLPAVARLCTRAVLLERGRVVKDASTEEVLEAYMSNVANSAAVADWSASAGRGEKGVALLSVKLLDPAGLPAASAQVGWDLRLVVRYRVDRPLAFRCSASFTTQSVVAFTAVERAENERAEPGVYESELIVPRDLLTEGEYTISIALFSSRGVKDRLAIAPDAISFLVSDPMTGQSARGDYAERIDGIVRPKLSWTTAFLSDGSTLATSAHGSSCEISG